VSKGSTHHTIWRFGIGQRLALHVPRQAILL